MLDPRLRIRKGGRFGLPLAGGRSGGDTASGGGTTVRVGGVNQSDYLKAHSLTLRLNSFDFTLVNPLTVPVVGDMVYLLEPAWDGQVVSVGHQDVDRGTDKLYTVTATNAKLPSTAAAAFAFSDAPDNVATFGYRRLTITTSRTDSGNKTRGTFTTFQQGLWPGMTFALTSANFSLVAQIYAVSNVTVNWPALDTNPQFDIEFGDAQLGLTQLGTNSGGLSTDADGTTTLRDPLGNLIFNSGTGFGAAWRRFLTSGVYNGDFARGPADPVQVITNVINPLPSWSFVRIGGTAINVKWVPDPLEGSGYVMRWEMVAGVAEDEAYLEQLVPINASRNRAYAYRARAYYFNGSGSASPAGTMVVEHQYVRADGSTLTGSPSTTNNTGSVLSAQDLKSANLNADVGTALVPADAYYMRIRIGLKRDTALTSTTATVDLAEVRLEGGIGGALELPDDTNPATNGFAQIQMNNKIMDVIAGYGSSAGTYGTIKLYSTAFDIQGTVFRHGGVAFPTSPAPVSNDIYYRTDLDMDFFYDGTRWLSKTLFHLPLGTGDAVPQFAVTIVSNRTQIPLAGVYDLWLENYQAAFYVLAGTALSGSHKWVNVLSKNPAATTVATITINSGSTDVWRNSGQIAINALVGTTNFGFDTTSTKTGTPGNLYFMASVTYRIVAT